MNSPLQSNPAQLFTTATSATGSAEAEIVRSNIEEMHLLLLGVESTEAEVDALFGDVFCTA